MRAVGPVRALASVSPPNTFLEKGLWLPGWPTHRGPKARGAGGMCPSAAFSPARDPAPWPPYPRLRRGTGTRGVSCPARRWPSGAGLFTVSCFPAFLAGVPGPAGPEVRDERPPPPPPSPVFDLLLSCALGSDN